MKTVTHPLEDRYLNLREGCHLMGLPEHITIDPADIRYIGKAIPSMTARDMAKQVKRFCHITFFTVTHARCVCT